MKTQLYFLLIALLLISCNNNSTNPEDSGSTTGTIRDVDGNVYPVIRIGTQWWMAENLRVTKYRDGEWIINVTGSNTWKDLTVGAYCYYGNNFDKARTYGNLYNWQAVHDPRNIAPVGWHVATDEEWQTLINYLGGNNLAGGKMKSTGTIDGGDGLWLGMNVGATNESGFSVLPGGRRNRDGSFDGLGSAGYFWSSTESGVTTTWNRYLKDGDAGVFRQDEDGKWAGYSIRCIKD